MVKEYYEILKIEENASKSEIRKAYIRLALEAHPDKGGDAEEFKKINKAYEVLKEYDGGNENISIVEYGCDYGKEVEEGELAIKKYTDHISEMNEAWSEIHFFYADTDGYRTRKNKIVGGYHLVRAENLLKLLDTYYKPKFLAAKSADEKHNLMKDFKFWTYDNWETGINRILTNLNYARKHILGLSTPLTVSDLKLKSIKGNDKNKTPRIPDGERPKPIEDGVVDINEYNNLWWEGNHSDIAKYKKLRDEIFDTSEKVSKYRAVNPTLYEKVKVNSKSTELEGTQFRKIWEKDKDDTKKISEIKRFNESKLAQMKELSKLMEKLIAEGENSKGESNSVSEPRGKKRGAEMEIEARNENNKKSRTTADELGRLISEATEINTSYEELEARIKKIDKYQGEKEYVSCQGEIDQLKIKLGNFDKDKFRTLSIEKIEEVMKSNNIKDSDLTLEEKVDLAKLKNENDVSKINELENKISEKIGKKGALNTLKDWLKQAQELVEGVRKDTVEHLRTELQKIQKGLYSFQSSSNTYQQSVYKEKENEVKQMLEKLESHSFQNNTAQPTKSGFRPVIVIPLVLLAVVVVAVGVMAIVRGRKQAKVKAK